MLAAAAGANRPAMRANAAPATAGWKRTRVVLSTRVTRFRVTTSESRFFRGLVCHAHCVGHEQYNHPHPENPSPKQRAVVAITSPTLNNDGKRVARATF